MSLIRPATKASRQLAYELLSGSTGLILALFMWGHMILVGSILTGERGFNWLATMLEDYYIAQPTVVVITALFLVHAVLAARKIPAQLEERRKMVRLGKDLKASTGFSPHTESMLWIWQVRTGMLMLFLGGFHLILLGIDVLTPLYGERLGIDGAHAQVLHPGHLARIQGLRVLDGIQERGVFGHGRGI